MLFLSSRESEVHFLSNILKTDIKIAEGKESYDECVKNTLANKEVLARILKHVVSEYEHYDIETIKDCIENVEVSKKTVHPNSTPPKISGMQTESSIVDEGVVRMDIVFSSYLPSEKSKIKLIINLEIQKSSNPGYALVTRGLYYCSRLISSQYGKEFKNSRYDDIKKVYSIWIICDSEGKMHDSILSYKISENVVCGTSCFQKNNYDKIQVVMIYLSKDISDNNVPYIIGMLDALLIDNKSANWRIDVLSNKFGVSMEDDMKGGLKEMCNLSEAVFERGEKQGFERGDKHGFERGDKHGFERGDKHGFEHGKDIFEQAVVLYQNGVTTIDKLIANGIDADTARRVINIFER